jgi:Rieske Fe-S protein
MVQETNLHRKRFLQLSARMAISLAGILGLGGLARFFSHKMEGGKPSEYELGTVDDFPSSGKLIRSDIPAVIYKTPGGYLAYSLVCTHLGCTVEAAEEGYECRCHGSQFDSTGRVLKGPADQPLLELEVHLTDDGTLILKTREDWK